MDTKSYPAKECVWDTVWKSTREMTKYLKYRKEPLQGGNLLRKWKVSKNPTETTLDSASFLSRQKGSLFPSPHLESGWEKHSHLWKPQSHILFVQHYHLPFSYKWVWALLQWGALFTQTKEKPRYKKKTLVTVYVGRAYQDHFSFPL